MPVAFSFNTTNDPFNVETNELVASMWRDAFGDEVEVSITPIEQGQYIGLALVGTFNLQGWRNHGGVDPTEQWYWWNSATASPIDPAIPELALNFGRFQDMEMDAAFTTIRQSGDPAERQAATEEVNRLFGKNVWNFWTTWTLWGVVADTRVQNIVNCTYPDGSPIKPVIPVSTTSPRSGVSKATARADRARKRRPDGKPDRPADMVAADERF